MPKRHGAELAVAEMATPRRPFPDQSVDFLCTIILKGLLMSDSSENEESFDDGNFVWKCSQPSLGRIQISAAACSYKGQKYTAGQTWVENGRAAMVCSKQGNSFLEKEIVGCVGDNGVQVGHMGVVTMNGAHYRCTASNHMFNMERIDDR
uniref:Ig-like domain-containing protein n=1 Tax=Romanomermis culicivorax TaxID=13658 RepID=A0A915KWJ7_ROMCU